MRWMRCRKPGGPIKWVVGGRAGKENSDEGGRPVFLAQRLSAGSCAPLGDSVTRLCSGRTSRQEAGRLGKRRESSVSDREAINEKNGICAAEVSTINEKNGVNAKH